MSLHLCQHMLECIVFLILSGDTCVSTSVLASASTSETDLAPSLLVPQCSSSSVGSAFPEDGEEEGLAGSVDVMVSRQAQ